MKKIIIIALLLGVVGQSMQGMKTRVIVLKSTQISTLATLNKIAAGLPYLSRRFFEKPLKEKIALLQENYTLDNLYKTKKILESIRSKISTYKLRAADDMQVNSHAQEMLKYMIDILTLQTISIMLDKARIAMVQANILSSARYKLGSFAKSLTQNYSVDNLQKIVPVLKIIFDQLMSTPSAQVPNIRKDMRAPVGYAIEKISQILDTQFKAISDFIFAINFKKGNVQISSLSKDEYNVSKLNQILGELYQIRLPRGILVNGLINQVLIAIGKKPEAPMSIKQQGQTQIIQEKPIIKKQEAPLQNIPPAISKQGVSLQNIPVIQMTIEQLEKMTVEQLQENIENVQKALNKLQLQENIEKNQQALNILQQALKKLQDALDKKQLQDCCICMAKEGKPGNIPCPTALQSKAKQHPAFICPECIQAVESCPICRGPLKK